MRIFVHDSNSSPIDCGGFKSNILLHGILILMRGKSITSNRSDEDSVHTTFGVWYVLYLNLPMIRRWVYVLWSGINLFRDPRPRRPRQLWYQRVVHTEPTTDVKSASHPHPFPPLQNRWPAEEFPCAPYFSSVHIMALIGQGWLCLVCQRLSSQTLKFVFFFFSRLSYSCHK